MTAFRDHVQRALADPALQQALDRNAKRRRVAWGPAFDSLPDAAGVRRRAGEIRRRSIDELDSQLETFTRQLEANGVVVHRAATANDACRIIVELLQDHGAQRVVKAKSMVTEEIGLNRALTAAGIEVVESDLGEFIVQLRGEPPAHITAPAIHLRREDVARTFESHLGMPYSTEVEAMTAAARRALRSKFLEAQAGISGVNFGVAETGTLCLVTNEGNGRMVTTLPPLHIAVMGIERLVPTLADLSVMLDVLPRAGTGQRRTSYVSLLNGRRAPDDPDGPSERHVVLVDNGRSGMRSSPLAESLACIRCGACLNACPVYQEIGGHAYGSIYPGPIGSVLSPGLWGTAAFGHLATASTLCGACRDACPVEIDLPTMLLRVRADWAAERRSPLWLRGGMRMLAFAIASAERYRLVLKTSAAASQLAPKRDGWTHWLPPPLGGWNQTRDFPPVARRPFRDRWPDLADVPHDPEGRLQGAAAPSSVPGAATPSVDARERFIAAAREAGCEVIECSRIGLHREIMSVLRREGAMEVVSWGRSTDGWKNLLDELEAEGLQLIEPGHAPPDQRDERLSVCAAAPVGLTGAVAGLADAGTLVLPGGPRRSQLASLLPPIHLAVLEESAIDDSLETWLAEGGARWITTQPSVVLITGPSRTADIEMTLTVGVHGPGQVVLFLIDGGEGRERLQ
jgi:L-lactate dehydrogenase complex protein LldF